MQRIFGCASASNQLMNIVRASTDMKHTNIRAYGYRAYYTREIPGQNFWPHKTIDNILIHVKCEGMPYERGRERCATIANQEQQQQHHNTAKEKSREKSKLCRLMWSKKRRNFWLISFQCFEYFSFSVLWIERLGMFHTYIKTIWSMAFTMVACPTPPSTSSPESKSIFHFVRWNFFAR